MELCFWTFNKKPIQLALDGLSNLKREVSLAAVSTAAAAATFSAAVTATATIAAATAATAATPTISTTTTATAAAAWAIFTGTSFVDRQSTALEVLGVKHLDGLLGVFLGRHFDECKTAGAASHAILHYVNRHHDAGLREMILQVVFGRGEGEVSYE